MYGEWVYVGSTPNWVAGLGMTFPVLGVKVALWDILQPLTSPSFSLKCRAWGGNYTVSTTPTPAFKILIHHHSNICCLRVPMKHIACSVLPSIHLTVYPASSLSSLAMPPSFSPYVMLLRKRLALLCTYGNPFILPPPGFFTVKIPPLTAKRWLF